MDLIKIVSKVFYIVKIKLFLNKYCAFELSVHQKILYYSLHKEKY